MLKYAPGSLESSWLRSRKVADVFDDAGGRLEWLRRPRWQWRRCALFPAATQFLFQSARRAIAVSSWGSQSRSTRIGRISSSPSRSTARQVMGQSVRASGIPVRNDASIGLPGVGGRYEGIFPLNRHCRSRSRPRGLSAKFQSLATQPARRSEVVGRFQTRSIVCRGLVFKIHNFCGDVLKKVPCISWFFARGG